MAATLAGELVAQRPPFSKVPGNVKLPGPVDCNNAEKVPVFQFKPALVLVENLNMIMDYDGNVVS